MIFNNYFNFVLWLTQGVYRKITFFALSSKNWNEIVNPIYNVFILYLNLSAKRWITINFHSWLGWPDYTTWCIFLSCWRVILNNSIFHLQANSLRLITWLYVKGWSLVITIAFTFQHNYFITILHRTWSCCKS